MSAPTGIVPVRRAALLTASAALLAFLLEPLAARRCLPAFGGGAFVWTSALFTFQALLLVSWTLARHLSRDGAVRLWRGLTLPAALLLVFAPSPTTFADLSPSALGVVASIALQAGPAFVLLTTCTALWTRALAHGGAPPGTGLFAAGNAGAAAALLLGPLLVDPWLGTTAESVVLGVALGALAVSMSTSLRGATAFAAERPRWSRPRSAWLVLPALGTALLATSTQALAQDLSVTPLLWTVPLFIYLLTWVLPFGWPRWAARRLTAPLLFVACGVQWMLGRADWRLDYLVQLGGHLFVLFGSALACHAEVYRQRPIGGDLPEYYFWTNVGGALGTAFIGFAVPALLEVPVEYPLVLLVCWVAYCVSTVRGWVAENALRRPSALGVPLAGLGLFVLLGAVDQVVRRTRGDDRWVRTAQGAMQVRRFGAPDSPDALVHLLDGRISHGWQWRQPERRAEPTAYFSAETGIGQVLSRPVQGRRVAIAGLGAGTLAAWARPGDHYLFVEVNHASLEIAATDFTFLADARGRGVTVEVLEQDARRALATRRGAPWNLVVLDAFAGDAIPAHLLTREAVSQYLATLEPDGCLAINVSNRHADLRRVVVGHARALGLWSGARRARSESPLGPYRSDWALLCPTPPVDPALLEAFEPMDTTQAVNWTDEHAPLWPLL